MATYESYANSQYDSGAGYMQSQDATNAAADGSASKKGRSASDKQTLVPVTIKQFQQAMAGDDDQTSRIDGRDVSQVTIVGLIQKIAPQSTFVNYTLDDGTGTIDVRQWIDTDESQFQTDERAEIVPNRYVRVVAYPRVFNGERSLVSMQIIPIRDFNEVTFHGLEVIATHLAATKTAGGSAMGGASMTPGPASYGASSGFKGQSVGKAPTPGASTAERCKNAVLSEMKAEGCPEEGLHINEIIDRLSKQGFGSGDVREVFEQLTSDCILYTTIDDDHYKITS